MKKLILPLISLLLLGCGESANDFDKVALNTKYYNNGYIQILEFGSELNKLIADEESFILYVYSPLCSVCNYFAPYLETFVEDSELYIYKMNENLLPYTPIDNDVKYTPTTIIFKNGSIAYKGDTGSIYENVKSYSKWVFDRIYKASEIEMNNSNATELN